MLYAVRRYAGLLYTILLAGLICVSIFGLIRFGPRVDLDSTYDRIGYWKVVWAMWQEHPILGVSVSAWQDVYKETAASDRVKPYISPDGRSWKHREVTHAHNLFFHLISCTGILGVASFCWLFVNCIRLVICKIDLCGHAMITWPVVFFVIGLTGWNIYGAQYQTIFAYFAALTGVMDNDHMDNN
jgi:O-antigen ligase